MKKLISGLAENADVVLGLLIATVTSILGIIGAVRGEIVANVTILTLATMSFIMLRDRHRSEATATSILNQFARLQESRVLTGHEIDRALAAARAGTALLEFKGATGTFTRAVTLPECLREASRGQRRLDVCIEIFDPRQDDLLKRYVQLYNGFGERGWTEDGTRRELLATILSACVQQEKYPEMLHIEVYLSSVLTTFRWDVTSSAVIITQRHPRFPAIAFDKNDINYDCWRTELHMNRQSAWRLPLEKREVREIRLGSRPAVQEVRKLFSCLEIPLPEHYGDDDVNELIGAAIHAQNPYE